MWRVHHPIPSMNLSGAPGPSKWLGSQFSIMVSLTIIKHTEPAWTINHHQTMIRDHKPWLTMMNHHKPLHTILNNDKHLKIKIIVGPRPPTPKSGAPANQRQRLLGTYQQGMVIKHITGGRIAISKMDNIYKCKCSRIFQPAISNSWLKHPYEKYQSTNHQSLRKILQKKHKLFIDMQYMKGPGPLWISDWTIAGRGTETLKMPGRWAVQPGFPALPRCRSSILMG